MRGCQRSGAQARSKSFSTPGLRRRTVSMQSIAGLLVCDVTTLRPHPPLRRYQTGISRGMAMTLRLTNAQAEALRARASREGRSMQQVARSALDEYLLRAEDDELTDRLAEQGAQRFADLLRRLGE